MMRTKGVLLVVVLTGCNISINQQSMGSGTWTTGPGTVSSADFTILGARMTGHMGNVPSVDQDIRNVVMEESGWDTTLNVVTDTAGGSAMALVEVPGGLGREDLQPGYQDSSLNPGHPSANTISITGCAGPARGEWDFDAPADETEVQVEKSPANPVALRMSFTARWRDVDSHAVLHEVAGWVDFARTSDLAVKPVRAAVAPPELASLKNGRVTATPLR